MQMVNFGSKVFNKYLLYSIIIAFSELSLSSPLTLIIFTSSSPFSKLLLLVTIKSSDTIAKYLHGFGGRKFMKVTNRLGRFNKSITVGELPPLSYSSTCMGW